MLLYHIDGYYFAKAFYSTDRTGGFCAKAPINKSSHLMLGAFENIFDNRIINAWRTEVHDVLPSSRTSFFPSYEGHGLRSLLS